MTQRTSIDRLQSSKRLQERSHWQPPRDDVVLYYAYGAAGAAVLEGRVIDFQHQREVDIADPRHVNFKRNVRWLFNVERQHMPVQVWTGHRQWQTVTDAEGYFRVEIANLAGMSCGWHPIHAAAGDATDNIGLLMVPPENVHGIISDVDDTILVTEVSSKRRMLINTFLRNPLQRAAVPGIAELYQRVLARNPRPAAAPMFYLSATPRQQHLPLQAFLDHNGLPPGVLITKRITNDSTSEPLLDQLAFKTARIEQILQRVPHVTFTLIGDDTEHDPQIFAALQTRHPQRIESIWIRTVLNAPRLPGQGTLADLLRTI